MSERWAWLGVRLSGVALLFLVLGHMFLMHVLVGVNRIDFAFVEARWAGLGWRAYDLALLLLALAHGGIGLRAFAYEHLRSGWRAAFLGAGWAVTGLVAVGGSWVIVSFPNPV